MKKLLLTSVVAASSIASIAQVNVSTTPETKTAVLEEYTGNFCTYCPNGHKIAENISNNYDAITIKIQTGDFSGTDPLFGGTLQTPTGELIAAPWDSHGYPNGTVSRRNAYAGIGRGQWTNAVATVVAEMAPVNLYVESSIDVTTGQLDVSVEYYYTADEVNSTNYLHIGYYQDDVPAYQYDPGFNPNQFYIIEDGLYDFDHCYRDNVNGTWGEAIAGTTTGSTGIINHTITLPSGFNGFDIENGAIKVYAFMSTTQQGEILNAEKVTPTYTNFPNADEIGIIYGPTIYEEGCLGSDGSVGAKVLVATYGENNLTSFNTDYGVNGNTTTDPWSGDLVHNEKVAVSLTTPTFTYAATNDLDITVALPNAQTDPDQTNNTYTTSFNGGTTHSADKIRLDVKTDSYAADESTFNVYDGSGATIFSSGTMNNSTTTSYEITLPAGTDCYKIEMLDDYGDAWGSGTTAWIKVYDITQGANTLLRTIDADVEWTSFYVAALEMTSAGSHAGLADNTLENVKVYPNPAEDVLNVSFNAESGEYTIEIMDLSGRIVKSSDFSANGNVDATFSLNEFVAGSYIVKVTSNNGVYTENVIIK